MKKHLLIWGLIGGLLLSFAKAQGVYISVQDEVDLTRIEGVSIQAKDSAGNLLIEMITDHRGRSPLPVSILDDLFVLHISHPEYHPLNIPYAKIKAQQYQVFLESKTYNFHEIVFTANKYQEDKEDIPYQIDVVKAQEIQFNNPQNSADLLLQKGSIFVQKSQMGGGSPNLRGFEANKVLIVVDGIRLNNAIFRSGHLQNVLTIDPAVIDRTEIMFGPSSVMYGSDALGGVMHFYTKNPELSSTGAPSIKTSFVNRYSSANQEKYAHVDLNIGFKKWGMLTSISAVDYGDLRIGNSRSDAYPNFGKREWYVDRINGQDSLIQNPDPNILRFTGYKQVDILQKFFFLNNNQLSHNINFQYSISSDIPRFDRLTQMRGELPRFASWNYGPQKRFLGSYQLKHTQKNSLYDQLSFVAGFQDIEESRINRSLGSDLRNHRIEQVQVLSVNLDANKLLHDSHELAYGLEAIANVVSSTAFREDILQETRFPLDTRYPDGGSEMNTLAAYFTHRWELNDKLTFTDGIRLTHIRLHSRFTNKTFFPFPFDEILQNNTAISGNLAGVYQPGNGWRFSLLGATGFRAPNVDDVAKVFDSQPGNVVVPNPNLKPEYSYNAELSISKTIGEILRIELTGFYTYYTNALVIRNFTLNGENFILYEDSLSRVQANVNAKTAFITGFNNNLFVDMDHWSFSNSLTVTYGQETETGVPMDHIPPLFGKTEATYKNKRFQAAAYILYNGWKRPERYSPRDENNAIFATEDGWPAWWTLNLKASYTLSPKIKVQLGIENIFDVHYRPFSSRISAPGRNLILSLRANL